MNILLYFASFGFIAVLFASFIATAYWLAATFFRAWARFFAALLAPPNTIAVRKPRIDLQHLKRAGQ